MKKRALNKDFRMEIKTSMNRFLSILLIVALGVSFFAGIQSAAPDMRETEDAYFDEADLMDLRVICTLGLTENDLQAIAEVDGVERAAGIYMEDVYSGKEDAREVLHFESFPDEMNEVSVVSGVLPAKAGECFLDYSYAEEMGYEPGDTLEIAVSEEDSTSLVRREFTISGIGYSPCYIAFSRGNTSLGTGSLSGFVYVLPEEFDTEIYSMAYVLVSGARDQVAYTDGYEDLVDEVRERIEEIEEDRCEIRYQEVVIEAESEIEEAKQEIEDGKQELEDAEAELADSRAEAESELSDAQAELLEAESELAEGRAELADARNGLADAEAAYEDGRTELEENAVAVSDAARQLLKGQADLNAGEIQYQDGLNTYLEETSSARAELEEAQAGIDASRNEINAGWAEYEAGVAEASSGEAQIAASREQLTAAQNEYDQNAAALQESQNTYDASVIQLEEGRAALEAAKAELQAGQEEYGAGREALDAGWAEYNANAAAAEAGWEAFWAAQAEVNAAVEAYNTASAQIEELRTGAEQADLAANDLQTAYDTAYAEFAQLSVSAAGTQEEAARLEAEVMDQEVLIETLQDQINAAGEEADTALLQEELAAASAALVQIQESLQSAYASLAEQQSAYAAAEEQVNALAAQLAEAEAASAALQAQLAEAEAVLAGSADQLAELEAAQLSLSENYAQLEAAQTALAEAEAELGENERALAAAKEELDAGAAEIEANENTIAAGEAQLAEAQMQLEAGWAQLNEAAAQISAGWQEIAANEPEIANAWSSLSEAYAQLEEGEAQLASAQAEVNNGYAEIENASQELNAARQELDAGWEEYNTSAAEFVSGWRELDHGRQEAEDARVQLAAARTALADGEKELAVNEKKIEQGWKDYEDGRTEADEKIADAEQEIADARADIEDGEKKVADAEAELADLSVPSWYVYDRSSLPDNTGYGENADRMTNIATVFPVIFFLVAALISLTTMTRMVEEERTEIGTCKALGYSRYDIAKKYLKYAFLATIFGSVLGVAFGEKLFPWVIIRAYGIMYAYMPAILTPYNLSYGVIATVIALVCTIGAALVSCFRALRTVPADLMRPPSPKQGKRVFLERIPLIWNRLNFNWKSTVRNLMRYKSRFLMTVLGIGGCMGLLLVGFGLRDSIMDVVLLQYDQIQLYDAMLILDTDASAEAFAEMEQAAQADARISASRYFYMQSVDIAQQDAGGTGKQWSIYLYVPEEPDNVGEFLLFKDRKTGEEYSLSDEGAIITEKIANEFGLSAGDTISLSLDDGGTVEVPIAAVCENYLSHYLYLTPHLYEQLYGEPPVYNSLFFCTDEDDTVLQDIGTDLLALDAPQSITYTFTLREEIEDMLSALNLVIIVLIVSAGLLAFVVLYNLNNININERIRELATLKVLGFYDMEVAAYVYRENILLTAVGAAAGCLIGKLMHAFIITTVEVDSTMFGRQIYMQSFLLGILFTVVFSVIVNFVMYFKLKKIDMIESLKSIE